MRPLFVIAVSLILPLIPSSQASASDIQLVTRSERAIVGWSSAAIQTNGPAISADGRFVVFTTDDAVDDEDGNGSDDVLLFDRMTGETILISRSILGPGRTANDESFDAVISADGSTVFFLSQATDLVSGFVASSTSRQLYAWDRATGAIRLVSHIAGNETSAGNGQPNRPSTSADGAFVVFESGASDHIVGTDTNGNPDIFRWTRATGEIELISRIAASPTTAGNNRSQVPSLSADGQRIAFRSSASDLTANDANGFDDIFFWDASSGSVTLVSQSTAGAGISGNAFSSIAQISADGSAIAFLSAASDLVAGTDTPFSADIFRWVVATGAIELVSHVDGDPTTAGNGDSGSPVISADGQVVAFNSRATDHVSAIDTNNFDIFRWRAGTGVVELLSTADGGLSAAGDCFLPRLTGDGGDVVFHCSSESLVPGTDQNGGSLDVFLWRDANGMPGLVSRSFADPTSTANEASKEPQISEDGGLVVFNSTAADLVLVGPDGGVYGFDRAADQVDIISRTLAGSTGLVISADRGRNPSINADGRYISLESSDALIEGVIIDNDQQIFLYDRVLDSFTLVTRSTAGPLVGASSDSLNAVISADGSAVVFVSSAPDLVAGFTPSSQNQIYHWDRASGVIRLVSHVPGDALTGGDRDSSQPAVSADGRTVGFASDATNLSVGPDANFSRDLFLWDAGTGDVRLISRSDADATATGDGFCQRLTLSADGDAVAFLSTSSNLIPGFVDVGSFLNAYSWDRATGAVQLLSASTAGATQSGNGTNFDVRISADGDAVVFSSEATDLMPGFVPGGSRNIFHWHRQTGEVRLVSPASGTTATASDGLSANPRPSADGESVVFQSRATNLVAGQVDAGMNNDVFHWDRGSGQVLLVSRSTAGAATAGDGASEVPLIADDGNRVFFESRATDLVPGFSGSNERNLFSFDRSTGMVELLSRSVAGPTTAPAAGASDEASISAGGSWVAFESAATDLTQGLDEEDVADVFLASLDEPATADLQLTLSSPQVTPLPPGSTFQLEATVENLGDARAAHPYVVLYLPPGALTLTGFSGAGWTCDLLLTFAGCGRGPLDVGDSATVTFTLQAPTALGPFGLGGSTIWNGVDPQLANNVMSFDAAVAPDDWGDAPDPGYPTLEASNGASHAFSSLFLGGVVDVDVDGQPDAAAAGDDADGSADEDGVALPLLVQGAAATLDVVASDAGVLDAWFDWNADGDWSDPGEKVIDGEAVAAGANTLGVSVPATASTGQSFARFRLSSTGLAAPTGRALDGEVEDYAVTIEARSDLAITKAASPEPVIAGETLTYTLTVSNLGPSPSTGAVANDPLPAGLSFLSSPDGCTEAGGTVSCPVAALAAGLSQVSSFVVTVDPSQTASLVNIASVLGNEIDPAAANNSSPAVTTTVMAESDLAVTMGVDLTSAVPGDTVTYTIDVAKGGPSDGPGTRVENNFPPALVDVTWTCTASAGSSCTASGSGDLDDIADLAAGGDVTYVATGTIEASFVGELENTVTATPAPGVDDPNPANNTASQATSVTSPADVSGTLEVLEPVRPGDEEGTEEGAGPITFQPGDTVTYIATLINASLTAQLDNPGPEFTDTLPQGLTLQTAVADQGVATMDASSRTVEWNGSVAADGLVTIEIEATVDYGTNGEILLNQGTLFFDADGDGTNEATTTTDDPGQDGLGDPTPIRILTTVEIPTLDHVGLGLLMVALGLLAVRRLGRG